MIISSQTTALSGSVAQLDLDGLVMPGERVSNDDILIGKTVPISITRPDGTETTLNTDVNSTDSCIGTPAAQTRKDQSVAMKSNESGIVDKVRGHLIVNLNVQRWRI
jgi:DNA-directed RNA polymerase II subunit RPB2